MTPSKRPTRRTALAGLLGLSSSFAADPTPKWQVLNHTARQAVDAKDYRKLRDTLLELKPLMPGNPRIIYNLAASEAKLGNTSASLQHLKNLAAMGLIYDLPADDDFASLKTSTDFAVILQQMAVNRKPISHSTTFAKLPKPDIIPEDITYDPKTRRFLVSSVRESTVSTLDGKVFATSPWSVFPLRIDTRRRLLWAGTAWVPHCSTCTPADKDKTALLAFNLDTGRQEQRIESPVPGLLGDMTISRSGDLYVSEGIHGAVFRLKTGAKTLERLDAEGEFPSPQTPALSADEKTLYIPDYVRGIAAMNLATREVQWLQPAGNIALNGIDGLYVYRDSFLAVQNGTNPPRVARFSLDLRTQQILEANAPELGEPTHGTFVGDAFYFLANTGWGEWDQNGKKKPGAAPVTSTVRKLDWKAH